MGRLKDWDQRIATAQLESTYMIGGVPVRRIAYGSERTRWRLPNCGDCDVRKGQLHVVGCDIEECPA